MKRIAIVAALVLLSASRLCADPCPKTGCRQVFPLASVSEATIYGLLLAAPDKGCVRVRFRVETVERGFLGHTPALGPGEVSVVRIGHGFAEGQTLLRIVAEGCATAPALVRRVTLAKRSPDHGARSTAVVAAGS
jgi:hypothetical protein